jgi:hypothetical protein
MDDKTVIMIGGLFLISVGALLVLIQIVGVRRFKGLDRSFSKTILPGLSLIFAGALVLVFFVPK